MNILDYCNTLLSNEKFENIVYKILSLKIGEWTSIAEFIDIKGEHSAIINNIFTCWTESIDDGDSFKLILFCDKISMEIVSGIYNKDYLFSKLNRLQIKGSRGPIQD